MSFYNGNRNCNASVFCKRVAVFSSLYIRNKNTNLLTLKCECILVKSSGKKVKKPVRMNSMWTVTLGVYLGDLEEMEKCEDDIERANCFFSFFPVLNFFLWVFPLSSL